MSFIHDRRASISISCGLPMTRDLLMWRQFRSALHVVLSKRNTSPRNRNRIRSSFVERLEDRWCLSAPGISSLSAQALSGNQALISGYVSDDDPTGVQVYFGGVVNGSTGVGADGYFSMLASASSLGTIGASAVNADGLWSDGASADLSVPAPAISLGATPTGNGTELHVVGTVSADNPAGLGVQLSGVAGGTVTTGADGSFDLYVDASTWGTLSVSTTDDWGQTATASAEVPDWAPTAQDQSYSAVHDRTLVVGVLAGASDVDGDPLSAAIVTGPAYGSLGLNSDGSFSYVPNAGFTGTDSFTFKANDGQLDSNVATVTIEVTNQNPVAQDDSATTHSNTSLTGGVLGNDSDADGDTLTASLVDGPVNGTLAFNSDGSFTYTPNTNFVGTDSFTYLTNDGVTNSNVASVTISVTHQDPVAQDDSSATDSNTSLTGGVLGNDTDPDGAPLTAELVDGPANGSVTFNSDGSFIYTPNTNYVGTDSFTYRASDGVTNSNVATVSIIVANQAPCLISAGVVCVDANTMDISGAIQDEFPSGASINYSGCISGSASVGADGSFGFGFDPSTLTSQTLVIWVVDMYGVSSSEVTLELPI